MRGHSASGSSCMPLDLPTIFAATVVANAIAGMLLFLSWTQYRNIPSLAAWSVAFLLGIDRHHASWLAWTSTRLLFTLPLPTALRSHPGESVGAGCAHSLVRPVPLLVVFAGAALWIVACQIDRILPVAEGANRLHGADVGVVSLDERVGVLAIARACVVLALADHRCCSSCMRSFFARIPLAAAWLERPEATVLRLDWLGSDHRRSDVSSSFASLICSAAWRTNAWC